MPVSAAAISATAKAVAAAAGGACFARASFVHRQAATAELSSVQGLNGPVGSGIFGHFDEAEATRLSGVTVFYQLSSFHLSISGECRFKILFRCLERKISNVDILHDFDRSSCAAAGTWAADGRFFPGKLFSAGVRFKAGKEAVSGIRPATSSMLARFRGDRNDYSVAERFASSPIIGKTYVSS